MPFTISHAAAVIPLFRVSALRPAALVIGAMMPDVSMFCVLNRDPCYAVTHSPWLSVPVGVVLGLCVLVVFEWSKQPLAALLPAWLQAKLAPVLQASSARSAREWLLCAASVALGVATHIVWDAFTHSNQFGVKHLVPSLHAVWIEHSPIGMLRGFKVLQHVSTVTGMGVVLLYVAHKLWRMPSSEQPVRPILSQRARTWTLIALALLIPMFCAAVTYHRTPGTGFEFWRVFARATVTRTFALQGVGLICTVLGIKLLQTRNARRP